VQAFRWKLWALSSLVAAVAIGLYAGTCGYDFTYLDDNNLILDQGQFLSRTSSFLAVFGRSYFGGASHSYYRPVVNLSFVIDAHWNGLRPFGYHLTNVVLHVAACVLLMRLLRALNVGDFPSVSATLLFAVHPLSPASVAWIPGRNDLLLGCFALCACCSLLDAVRDVDHSSETLHLACFGLALLCKESAQCLPIIFVVLLWSTRRTQAIKLQRSLWIGWGGCIVVYWAARSAVLSSGTSHISVAVHLKTAVQHWPVLLSDLGKLMLPLRLQVVAAEQDILAWPGVLTVAAFGASVFVSSIRPRLILLAATIAITPLAFSLPGAKVAVLESRSYLPTVGMCVLIAEWLRTVSALVPTGIRETVSVVLVAACFVVSARHRQDYLDAETFCRAAINGSPHSPIAANLVMRNYHRRSILYNAAGNARYLGARPALGAEVRDLRTTISGASPSPGP
jgi:hypothetical protein